MNDRGIARACKEACEILAELPFDTAPPHLSSAYRSVRSAARRNHPEDPFLSDLPEIEGREPSIHELRILFSFLRIGLETLMEEKEILEEESWWSQWSGRRGQIAG